MSATCHPGTIDRLCPDCARSARVTSAPPAPPPAPPPPAAAPVVIVRPIPSAPAAPAQRSAPLAAALSIVPGVGHAYAGAWGRALLGFFVFMPTVEILFATDVMSAKSAVLAHGLVAADAYRAARTGNGDWTARRSSDVRSAIVAVALAAITAGVMRLASVPVTGLVDVALFMIFFGVALAWPGARAPAAPKPAPAPSPKSPAPGETVDRRADRAELARAIAREAAAAGPGGAS
jgi:hypothetical protein